MATARRRARDTVPAQTSSTQLNVKFTAPSIDPDVLLAADRDGG